VKSVRCANGENKLSEFFAKGPENETETFDLGAEKVEKDIKRIIVCCFN